MGKRRSRRFSKTKKQNKMKKLIIAAAIVCAAVASEAASFTWMTPTVFLPFTKSTIEAGTFNAATSGSTKKISSFINDGAVFLATIAISDDGGTTWTETKNVTIDQDSGAISTTTSNDAFELPTADGVTKTLNYKILITGTYTDSNDKEWQISASPIEGKAQYTNVSYPELGTAVPAKWTFATGTGPVPEPTSGLLLLLGVAGLALRRRA